MGYSKSKVNRAGALLSEQLRLAAEDRGNANAVREEVVEALEIIEWWRGEHARPLSRVAANLRYYAADEGRPVVAQRLKRVPTIAGKLLREPGMKLARMGDIGGVRAIMPDREAAYRIANRLRRNWTIVRFSDYIARPKPDGYRALHLINRHRGRLVEVQLRTPLQDDWANTVEAFSRAFAPGLKFGHGPEFVRDYFTVVAATSAALEQGGEPDPALRTRFAELIPQVGTFIREAEDDSR